MYSCSFKQISDHCNLLFTTPEAFFLHLQIYHINSASYSCGDAECARSFQRLDSLKRHVRNKHALRRVIENPAEVVHLPREQQIEPIQEPFEIDHVPLEENEQICEPHFIDNTFETLSETFLAALHSDDTLTRTTIQRIIETTSRFMCNIGTTLENFVVSNEATRDNFTNVLNFLNNPFPEHATEYQRIHAMKNKGTYVSPVKIFIGQRVDEKMVNGRTVRVPVPVTLTFIPLRKLFHVLFSIPTVFKVANSFLQEEVYNPIDDIAHSTFWREKRQFFGDKFVVPLFIYYDEFECNNPFGSHTGIHKIGAVYVSLRCFPVQFQSRLENIFMVLLIHDQDIVNNGNQVFQILVDELTFLETEGISIDLENGETRKIYFSLAMILGDNAGLNAILGYSGCSSNYFCRMCRGHKQDLLKSVEEVPDLLRTRENYNNDLLLNDFQLTGLKEYSVFNQIPSFHVIENNAVDIMHDMLEGVCNYDITLIIEYYLHVQILSLDSLNAYVQNFDYGYIEYGNKPPVITQAMLTKKMLNMQASEMMCMMRNFGLMIGDAIPEDDTVWKLYTTLCQIMDIVMSPVYHIGTHNLLKVLIEEHHQLYIATCKKVPKYENDRLKPKFHIVTHYPRLLHLYGPLRSFWCMRFERKHEVAKKITRMTGSRVNIIQTIALTQQLRLGYSLLNYSGIENSLKVGPRTTPQPGETPENFDETYIAHKWANYNGRLYKTDRCVVNVSIIDDLPCFGFLTGIFVRESRLYFTFKRVPAISFNEHKHSYIVDISRLSSPNVEYIDISGVLDSTPLHLRKVLNCHYVTLPYTL